MWVRGLKLSMINCQLNKDYVAPRVGAWIETLGMCYSHSIPPVAPRVGAWIETLTMRCLTDRIKSHVTPFELASIAAYYEVFNGSDKVAPRVGAWIETVVV